MHGNIFWYQRAVPKKVHKLIGVKSIKVSLKTNKVNIAIQRSKLQALEHKKMFGTLSKIDNPVFKFLNKKKTINLKSYEIKFMDDYDDLVSNHFFSNQSMPLNEIQKNKKKSLENYLFNVQNSIPMLSDFFRNFFANEYNFKVSEFKNYKRSLDFFISVCGDKPINSYDFIDARQLNEKFNSIEKNFNGISSSKIKNIFTRGFRKFNLENNEFIVNLKIVKYKNNANEYIFSTDELKNIEGFCKKSVSFESSILAVIVNTGCSYREIIGLDPNDIYIDRYQSFISIRSNGLRQIKNLYKIRTVPLVGLSLWGGEYLYSELKKNPNHYLDKEKIVKTEIAINKIIRNFSELGSIRNFKKSLISRLVYINCPEEVILDIVGKSKKHNLYNSQISVDLKRSWLEQLKFI